MQCSHTVREGCAQVFFALIIHSQTLQHIMYDAIFNGIVLNMATLQVGGQNFICCVTRMPINDSPMSRVAKGLIKYGLVVKRAEWWSGMTKCVTMATL